jgi:hypothetical protein
MPPRLRRGIAGRAPVFASIYALAFALQLKKITVKPRSGHAVCSSLKQLFIELISTEVTAVTLSGFKKEIYKQLEVSLD